MEKLAERSNRIVRRIDVKASRRQSGQATTEYVMLIAVLIVAVMAVGKVFRDNMNSFMLRIGQQISREMFASGRIHQLPPGLRPR